MKDDRTIERSFDSAKSQYFEFGVDPEQAMETLKRTAVSVHCWQGDDVTGFENASGPGGGIQATGNFPGKAQTADQLRADMKKALSLIPGRHRVNLHAMYAETGGKTDRDEIGVEHFGHWIDWAAENNLGIDFNPTFFAHPKAASGFTLASADEVTRKFWVRHGVACRRIANEFGRKLTGPAVCNIWIPDGYKDIPADRKGPRERLKQSLDQILAEKFEPTCLLDSVEGKLFGIGSESYVAGSHEFYLSYALKNNILLCLDTGHFHPTELVADKISAVLTFLDRILLHVSRPVRWDSDHVVILSDELLALTTELVRGDYLGRVHIGLDFFDASINRIAAWVIGTRATLKALLLALLEPSDRLRQLELSGDYTARLALQEHIKTLPFGAVWDYYCLRSGVPVGYAWMDEVRDYEKNVLSKRDGP